MAWHDGYLTVIVNLSISGVQSNDAGLDVRAIHLGDVAPRLPVQRRNQRVTSGRGHACPGLQDQGH